MGNGDGTFGAPTPFRDGRYPYSIAMGDFTGDGKLDLAVNSDTADPSEPLSPFSWAMATARSETASLYDAGQRPQFRGGGRFQRRR